MFLSLPPFPPSSPKSKHISSGKHFKCICRYMDNKIGAWPAHPPNMSTARLCKDYGAALYLLLHNLSHLTVHPFHFVPTETVIYRPYGLPLIAALAFMGLWLYGGQVGYVAAYRRGSAAPTRPTQSAAGQHRVSGGAGGRVGQSPS